MSNPFLTTQPKQIRVVGFDPSLRNWGMSKGVYTPSIDKLVIQEVGTICPSELEGKQVRNNSNDLECAKQLAEDVFKFSKDAQAIFVEVPVGSQSARAMASYGICVGILGALRATGIPFFEVTPIEVKKASVGSKTATKAQMIKWAIEKHPEAPWTMQKRGGVLIPVDGKVEHQADATAAIYAGLETNAFKQLLSLLN